MKCRLSSKIESFVEFCRPVMLDCLAASVDVFDHKGQVTDVLLVMLLFPFGYHNVVFFKLINPLIK